MFYLAHMAHKIHHITRSYYLCYLPVFYIGIPIGHFAAFNNLISLENRKYESICNFISKEHLTPNIYPNIYHWKLKFYVIAFKIERILKPFNTTKRHI